MSDEHQIAEARAAVAAFDLADPLTLLRHLRVLVGHIECDVLQFKYEKEAWEWLASQGFCATPESGDRKNERGDSVGVYDIERDRYGRTTVFRVDFNPR